MPTAQRKFESDAGGYLPDFSIRPGTSTSLWILLIIPRANMLFKASANGNPAALHDAAESYPQPRCHPETRQALLEDLSMWCTSPSDEPPIL
ncbi:hypothetical protein B0H19DRAFT_1255131 [Mycena capillaripes]|nr:hypothetical protein B0H19DRAFT_1255131 [Mycena capillaripes]